MLKLIKMFILPKKKYCRRYLQKQFENNITKYIIYSMILLKTVKDRFARIFENLGLCWWHDNSLQITSRRKKNRRVI